MMEFGEQQFAFADSFASFAGLRDQISEVGGLLSAQGDSLRAILQDARCTRMHVYALCHVDLGLDLRMDHMNVFIWTWAWIS
jgi:hypothetical protein